MKKYLPYILGALLILWSIAAKGLLKRHYKQAEQEAREQQRQTSMENLKQSLSNREQEQKENGTPVITAEPDDFDQD